MIEKIVEDERKQEDDVNDGYILVTNVKNQFIINTSVK